MSKNHMCYLCDQDMSLHGGPFIDSGPFRFVICLSCYWIAIISCMVVTNCQYMYLYDTHGYGILQSTDLLDELRVDVSALRKKYVCYLCDQNVPVLFCDLPIKFLDIIRCIITKCQYMYQCDAHGYSILQSTDVLDELGVGISALKKFCIKKAVRITCTLVNGKFRKCNQDLFDYHNMWNVNPSNFLLTEVPCYDHGTTVIEQCEKISDHKKFKMSFQPTYRKIQLSDEVSPLHSAALKFNNHTGLMERNKEKREEREIADGEEEALKKQHEEHVLKARLDQQREIERPKRNLEEKSEFNSINSQKISSIEDNGSFSEDLSQLVEYPKSIASQLSGSQPPGTRPPSTQPLGTQPPSTRPLSSQPPGGPPPGSQHPGGQPPSICGLCPSTRPPGTQPLGSQPPSRQPPGGQPPGSRPSGSQLPSSKPPTPCSQPPGGQPRSHDDNTDGNSSGSSFEDSLLDHQNRIILQRSSYRPPHRVGFHGPRYFSEPDSDHNGNFSIAPLTSNRQYGSDTSIYKQSLNFNANQKLKRLRRKKRNLSVSSLESSHYDLYFTHSSGSEL